MLITFYQNKSAPNVIPKDKTKKFDKTGTLKNNTSITNPTILLQLSDYDNVRQANYCFISDFNRYFYIDDIRIVNALVEVSMTCDVLETYKEDILNSTQLVARQENKKNYSIIDDRLPMCSDVSITCHYPDKTYDTFTTSEGFFVLGTTGGTNGGVTNG